MCLCINYKMETDEKHRDEVTLDDILTKLGPFGKFNVFNYILILFPVFLAGMYSSVYNFEVMDLDYRCSIPECADDSLLNYSIPHDDNGIRSKCRRFAPITNGSEAACSPDLFDTTTVVECHDYVYLETHSIVKDFDLGCQDWKRTLVGTVHNAGFFLSIPLTGVMSDRWGRKVALIFACVSNGVFGVLRGVSTSYNMFVVFEFLEPAFGAGVYTACFVLALELVKPKGRVFASLLFNSMFILGGVTVTLLSWYLKNWRHLLFAIYTPSIILIVYVFLLSESFKWYFSKGQYEKGIKVLKKAEKMNNANVPEDDYVQVEKLAMKERDDRKKESQDLNESAFTQLLKSTMIWKRLTICSFLWIASTLVYYGLSINAIELSGNSYLNYIVIIVIEAPANVCKLMCLDRFGRKKVIATAYFMTGVILIVYGFVPIGNWSLTLYLGGKFFITLAYNSLYVFAAEVFPTNYRTTLLAVCSTIGRIGSTVAPQTPLLAKLYTYLPTIVFGSLAAISSLVVLLLPETRNLKLPDSLKEAIAQDKPTTSAKLSDHDVEKSHKTRL